MTASIQVGDKVRWVDRNQDAVEGVVTALLGKYVLVRIRPSYATEQFIRRILPISQLLPLDEQEGDR